MRLQMDTAVAPGPSAERITAPAGPQPEPKGSSHYQLCHERQVQHHDDINFAQWQTLDQMRDYIHTVNGWRHRRYWRHLDPLLTTQPGAEWLAVGDGKFGLTARYIEDHGGLSLATDIATRPLEHAQRLGFIRRFARENAESLSCADRSFDFAVCKSAYHHLPRPYLALYEMARVTRRGFILLEPLDTGGDGYEDSGNYVYTISVREMHKTAIGLGMRWATHAFFNDIFIPKMLGPALESNPNFLRIRDAYRSADQACRQGTAPWNCVCVGLFHQLSPADREALTRFGFTLRELPQNPHTA